MGSNEATHEGNPPVLAVAKRVSCASSTRFDLGTRRLTILMPFVPVSNRRSLEKGYAHPLVVPAFESGLPPSLRTGRYAQPEVVPQFVHL